MAESADFIHIKSYILSSFHYTLLTGPYTCVYNNIISSDRAISERPSVSGQSSKRGPARSHCDQSMAGHIFIYYIPSTPLLC